jgi:uncharacterized protein (TIGR00251 family)
MTSGWIRADGDDVLLTVWVVPGSSRSSVDGLHGDALKVRVAAPPERGRANAAVADLLGGVLGVTVHLESGANARRKVFRAPGVSAADAARMIGVR